MSTISPRRRHPTNATNRAPPRTTAINAAAIKPELLAKRTKSRWAWAAGGHRVYAPMPRRLLARQRQVARLVPKRAVG